jgi:SAM-dependent methyltransferase
MESKEFSPEYWSKVWADIPIPQEVHPGDIPEIHRVLTSVLPTGERSFIEIGCAPGKWMAYFARQFGYSVSGLDYIAGACARTRENLDRLSIDARVHHADFFSFEPRPFDVVFSAGFIEHFERPEDVISRLVRLCNPKGGFIITMIPSMEGLNRWISKTFRPRVAAGHFPLGLLDLISLHEAFGIRTLYANHIGGLHILPPVQKNRFAEEHPGMSFLLNLPFRLWNRTVKTITGVTGLYPHTGLVTHSILYVGRRSGEER